MILKITKSTDPVWRYKFKNVSSVTAETKRLVRDMEETLAFTGGVGLAAPQVGEALRLFIVDYGSLRETFINPKVLKIDSETTSGEEGCLSIPGYRGLVKRAKQLTIEYLDSKGKKKQATLTGFYARIVQHEYDHLTSVFYVDRVVNKKKNLYQFEPIRLVFFGTPEFAAVVLKSLIGQATVGEYTLPLVVTAPPKLAGRKQERRLTQVEELAIQFDIPFENPSWLARKGKDGERQINQGLVKKLKAAKADCFVVASYGKILPREILSIPAHGCLNIHASLLPKYRGASPIQTAIASGDPVSGVTIMKMNEKMDEGPVIASVKQKVLKKDTFETLSRRLALLGSLLINQVLHLWVTEKLKTKAQNHKKATYTKILTREDGRIDLAKPPKNLSNLIRAYHPWPGVWADYNGKVLKLLPGRQVQLEGKKPISLKEFKAGHKDFNLTW